MVYRGKPSAGCENCRKAKKRCGLELPSCLRCVKLKKTCTGYRDTSQLQIEDESAAVRQKAERQRVKHGSADADSHLLVPADSRSKREKSPPGIPTPLSMSSDSSSGSDSTIDLNAPDRGQTEGVTKEWTVPEQHGASIRDVFALSTYSAIQPKPSDVASNYFFYQFTSPGQWEHIRDIARRPKLDPCLELAIRACGMAALTNVEMVPAGKAYAQVNYVEALGLVNQALRDPVRSRSDEALIAVLMLAYYENISCDSYQSMVSWKAHTAGATQMLKLRGKAQFKSHAGRLLFRELRAQIIISCLWDDSDAPSFLEEYQSELDAQTPEGLFSFWKVADVLTGLFYKFARLRRQLFTQDIPNQQGVEKAAEIERAVIQWGVDAVAQSEFWQFYELEVDDSEHVWDGKVLAYAGNPAPTIWNQYRIFRIMLSRTQEMLCRRVSLSEDALAEQQAYFRRTRRKMTDEICQTIPACLGHASPAFSSSCVLATAYASVWSLFMAATTLIERVGPDAKYILDGLPLPAERPQTAAYAQMSWVTGRLRYISQTIGLKWADGVAAILRGEFRTHPKGSEYE